MKLVKKIMLLVLSTLFLTTTVCAMAINAFAEETVNTVTVLTTDGTVSGNALFADHGATITTAPTSYLETEVKGVKSVSGWDAVGVDALNIDVSGWNREKLWISYYLYIADVSGLGDNSCRTSFGTENFWYKDGQIVSSMHAGWNLIKMPMPTTSTTITQISVTINSTNKPDLYVTDIRLCDDGSVTEWSATKVANCGEVLPPDSNSLTVLGVDGTVSGTVLFADHGATIATAPASYLETEVKGAKNVSGWDAVGVDALNIDVSGWNREKLWISYYLYIADVSGLGDNSCRTSFGTENFWYKDGQIVSSMHAGWNLIKMPMPTTSTTITQISVTINSTNKPDLYITDIKLCDDGSVTAWSATKVDSFVFEDLDETILSADGTIQNGGSIEWADHGSALSDKVPTGMSGKSVAGVDGWGAAALKGLNVDISKCVKAKLVLSFYVYLSKVENIGNAENYVNINGQNTNYFNECVSNLKTGWNFVEMPISVSVDAINSVTFNIGYTIQIKPVIYIYNVTITDKGNVTEPTVTVIEEVSEEEKPLDLTPVSIIGAENPKAVCSFEKSHSVISTVPVGMTGKSLSLDATNNDSKGWFYFDDMMTGLDASDIAESGNGALDFWIYISDVEKLHEIKIVPQKADPVSGIGQIQWDFYALYADASATEAGFVNGWNHVTIKAVDLGGDPLTWNVINRMYFYVEWKDSTARNCFIYDLKLISVEQEERIVIFNQVAPELTVSENQTVTYSKDGINLNQYATVTENDAVTYSLYFICDDEVVENGLFMPENKNETYTVQVQLRADNFAAITKTIEITVEADESIVNEPSDSNSDGETEGGCSASVGVTSSLIAAVLALAGTMFVCKKKND